MGELVFTRQRLVDSIGTDVGEMAPMTLLDAPKGYGKTTLLNQWLNQVDQTQADVYKFQVERNQATDDLWQQVLQAVGATLGDASSDLRALAAWVSNLAKPTVLVIDNYEQITDDTTDSTFAHLLTLNDNFFLVASGRYFMLLSGPLARAALITKVVGREHLAFTDAEVEQALSSAGHEGAQNRGGVQNSEGAQDGEGAAQGAAPKVAPYLRWPWALAQLHPGAAEPGGDPEALADAIFDDIPDVYAQRVLHAVSQTGGAAHNALSSNMGMAPTLILQISQSLRRRGLICRDPRPTGVWFTMPPEMREVLRLHRVAPHTNCGFGDFMVDHADLIAITDPAEALRIYLRFNALDRAEASVVNDFDAYSQHSKEIEGVLSDFPIDSLLEHPVLLGLRLIQERMDPTLPLASVDKTAQQILTAAAQEEENRRTGRSIIIETLLVYAERIQGNWKKALKRARKLETSLSGYADHGFQQASSGLPMIFAVVAITGILAGDLALAKRAATRALEVSGEQGNVAEEVRAHYQLALIHSLQLEVTQSEQYLSDAAELEHLHDIEAPDTSWINREVSQGLNAVRTRDYDRANQALDNLLPGSTRMEQWPLILLLQSYILRNTKGPEAALVTLQQALVQHPQLKHVSPHLRVMLQARLATLAVYAGHFSAAETILGQADIGAPKVAAAWGRLRLFQREFTQAHQLFQEVRDQVPTDAIDVEMILVGALGAYGAGSQKESAQLLQWANQLLDESTADRHLRALPYNVLREAAVYAKDKSVVNILPLVESISPDQRAYAPEPLSVTEEATLQRLHAGFTLAQIATDMGVSQNTVKFHRTNIYRKLGVSTKAEAVRKGTQMGVLP